MKIIKTIREMQALSRTWTEPGQTLGLVPTMGALHEGHLSLVRRAQNDNDYTVVSIFVNPTQFGPNEDFSRYPRDEESDIRKLQSCGVDAVFLPSGSEMYPEGFSTSIIVGEIGNKLCGASRPGHFNGVATVVAKLFNIVIPERAYFGQKDFQQTVVIRKLVDELNFDISIVVCPTVREPDGLAMSSRNQYLNDKERKAAAVLYRALKQSEDLYALGTIADSDEIRTAVRKTIASEPLARTEYIDVVDTDNLAPVRRLDRPAAVCVAVRIGNTRLIDNIILS